MQHHARLGFGLTLAIGLNACGSGRDEDFEPGLEPLEPMQVDAPEPGADGQLPQDFELQTGEADEGLLWGHLRGYVHAPLPLVWAAYQRADVVVDRRRVERFTARPDIEPEYDFSLAIDQVVRDILTVEYTLTWRHGAVGDPLEPDKVSMRWQKTDGTPLIDTLRGSVVLLPTDDPDITEIQSIEHLKAPRTDTDEIEGLLTDVWFDVIAAVEGEPLPIYD